MLHKVTQRKIIPIGPHKKAKEDLRELYELAKKLGYLKQKLELEKLKKE